MRLADHVPGPEFAEVAVTRIAVLAVTPATVPEALLGAISTLFPVSFLAVTRVDWERCDAALLLGGSASAAHDLCASGGRCLALVGEGAERAVRDAAADVHLGDASHLERCFHGRALPDRALQRLRCLTVAAGDEVVARKGAEALWVHRQVAQWWVDFVAAELPPFGHGDYLYQYFQKDDWARLLPLLHFVIRVCGWRRPPIRACFMFDDPNMHWRAYGYVKYDRLAEHAAEHDYHVALATVPMDSWYVHPGTAALFREHPDRLSLVVHGNDHTYWELVRPQTDAGREALAAQALRRVARLEQRSAVQVPKVMAPPHGVCDHRMGTALLRTGFEAACISRSSLLLRNPATPWAVAVGLRPAEFLGSGLPVLPRFNIRWDFTSALFAAFLGQPVIPVGHHDDLAGGLDILRDWARSIHDMGAVQWTDVGTMVRTNFCTTTTGDVLNVWMYARSIAVDVPCECSQVRFHRPWSTERGFEDLSLTRGSTTDTLRAYEGQPVTVAPGQRVLAESVYSSPVDPAMLPASRRGLWPVVRRQLCEVRDRLRPAADGLRGHRLAPPVQSERILRRGVS